MDMIGEILFPKEDIDTGVNIEIQQDGKTIANVTKKFTLSKKFNNKTELIGKIGTSNKKTFERYGDNPWGVKVGTYQKCEKCNKVGIVNFTLDTHPGDKNPVTRLYKRLTHDNLETHNIPIWRVEGTYDYEQLVEMWMKQ